MSWVGRRSMRRQKTGDTSSGRAMPSRRWRWRSALVRSRCLVAATGDRVWETQDATSERARWASAFIVQHEDRVFINNDRGDLIIARLTPEGYEEIDRTPLIAPTSRPGNRRELTHVNWSHPAYANRHIIARNDEEIISASLAAP